MRCLHRRLSKESTVHEIVSIRDDRLLFLSSSVAVQTADSVREHTKKSPTPMSGAFLWVAPTGYTALSFVQKQNPCSAERGFVFL